MTASVDKVIVAAVPSWVAFRVAVPEPNDPQSNDNVAVSGVTAWAAGAMARVVAAMAPTPSRVPIPGVRCFMGGPAFVWGHELLSPTAAGKVRGHRV